MDRKTKSTHATLRHGVRLALWASTMLLYLMYPSVHSLQLRVVRMFIFPFFFHRQGELTGREVSLHNQKLALESVVKELDDTKQTIDRFRCALQLHAGMSAVVHMVRLSKVLRSSRSQHFKLCHVTFHRNSAERTTCRIQYLADLRC